MKKVVYIISFLLISVMSFAQTFPVRLTPQALPPHPIYINDYANTNVISDRLRLQVLLNDLTINNLEVRLKVHVEGQGIQTESRDNVIGAAPIILDGGVPLQLGSVDLAPYFEFQNLQGIDASSYASALPEGVYQFCFEIFEAQTGNRLSQKTCASAIIFQNEPPLLSLPHNNSAITYQDNYNILFQWTPRHINVSNVRYELSIAQVFDDFIDPQTVFANPSLTIFQETVDNTSLLYDLRYPPLQPGYRYAWRVRAFAEDGADQIGVFNNQGYSEIWSFTYNEPCNPPEFVREEEIGKRHVKIAWQDAGQHLDFTVSYREKNANSDWYVLTTPRDYIIINNLRPETTYEYRVGGYCDLGSLAYGPIQEFSTAIDRQQVTEYMGCNIEPDPVDLANQELINELYVNDLIFAGDFPVTILELASSTSPFTGRGYIGIPWLNFARVGVEFSGIKVNTDFKLVDGFIQTTYDADWGDVVFVDPFLDPFEGDNDVNEVEVDFDVDTIEVDEDGNITIIGVNGEEIEYPGGDDYVIIDTNPDGTQDIYYVDEEGNVTEGGQVTEGGPIDTNETSGFDSNGELSQLSAEGIKVTFDPSGFYGYDKIPNSERAKLQTYYKPISNTDGTPYDIVHKAVKNGSNDILIARIETDDDALADRLVFKTKQGAKIEHTLSPNKREATLQLKGKFSFEYEDIFAVLLPENGQNTPQTIAGSFKLWHLSQHNVEVTIVPINDVEIDISENEIEEQLNTVFNPAMVNLSVTLENSFSIDPNIWGGDTIDVGNSGLFSYYTDEQKAIYFNYKDSKGVIRNKYYIFVTDTRASIDASGFMPLKEKYGFIFKNVSNPSEEYKDSWVTTMAHELGHGIFGLKHPFDEYGTSVSNTGWLMDYGVGTTFNHMDWKKMHNPDFELYWFQSDEEGQSVTISDLADLENFKNTDGTYSFVTPYGNIVTVPPNVQELVFSTGDIYELVDKINPLGSLIRFTLDNKVYAQTITVNNATDQGYQAGNEVYIDVYTDNLGPENIKPIIGRLVLNNDATGYLFQVTTVQNFSQQEDRWFKSFSDDKLLAVDKISRFFRTNTEYLSVPASLSAEFENDLVEQYIFDNKEHAMANSPYVSFVIGLSSLIHNYPEVHSACNTASYEAFKQAFPVMQEIENIPIGVGPGSTGAAGGAALANYLQQLDREDYYKKYFEIYLKAPGFIEELESNTALSADGIENIIDELDDCQCALKLLSFERRLEIYNKLLQDGLDDYDDIFAALLFNTPEEEMERWYNVFIAPNNADNIIYMYNQLGDSEKEIFVYFMVKLTKQFGQPPTFANRPPSFLYDEYVNRVIPINTNHMYVLNTGLIGDCGGLSQGRAPCRHYSTSKYTYPDYTEIPNTMRFTYASKRIKFLDGARYYPIVHYFYEGHPLTDYIKLDFVDDFNYAGIEGNTSAIVPMLWAHHFARKHADNISSLQLRFALGTLALIAAPFTGGGTLVVVLEVTIAAGDIIIAFADDEIRGLPGGTEFLNLWDTASGIYGAAILIDGVGRIVVNSDEIVNYIKNKPLNVIARTKEDFATLMQKVKEFTSESRAALFENNVKQAFKTADLNNSIVDGFTGYTIEVKNYNAFHINNESVGTVRYLDESNDVLITEIPDSKMLADDATIPGDYIKSGELRINIDNNGQADSRILEAYLTPNGNYRFRFKTSQNSGGQFAGLNGVSTSLPDNFVWESQAISQQEIWFNVGNQVEVKSPYAFVNETSTQNNLFDWQLPDYTYIKFDDETGFILLAELNRPTPDKVRYHAFGQIDPNEYNAIKETFVGNQTALQDYLLEKIDQLKYLSGLKLRPREVDGVPLNFSRNKVNTVLGRYNPDIKALFSELGSFKNIGLGETRGGINLLNRPDAVANRGDWWEDHNLPWLRDAINRQDAIHLATIPDQIDQVIDLSTGALKGAYAKELNHLYNRNYAPVNITSNQWTTFKSWFAYANVLRRLEEYPNVRFWISELDPITDGQLISKIDNLEADDLAKLNVDITNPNYIVKQLITENPDDLIDIWKRLYDESDYAWELRRLNSRWESWAMRQFFKDKTQKGKLFEETTVLQALSNRSSTWYGNLKTKVASDYGKNLDEYDLFKQVQLKYDGEKYFVADQVFVKFTTNDQGLEVITDLIVIENKLKQTTALTPNQTSAKNVNSYTVRNQRAISSEYGTARRLTRDNVLSFDGAIKWFKVYDSENGTEISNIVRLN